jgi:hypothetical protein
MQMHTLMHAVSHHINISGPHIRSCDHILKQYKHLSSKPVCLYDPILPSSKAPSVGI